VAALAAGAVLFAGSATGLEYRRSALSTIGWGGRLTPDAEAPRERRSGGMLDRIERWRATRRADLVQDQLADAISAIAAGSRAGMSLPQAVGLAGEQVPEPLGGSLRAVVDATRLGVSLEDALDRWVTAIEVPDVRLAAAVLRLHRRTGGALAPVLEGLARTLRERRAAVREVRSLTAQARLSGAILGLLPIGFFLFLLLTSRRDMAIALGSPLGRTAIAAGLVLETAAFLWIRRLLRVEP
jgi:tight adherence protein B